MKRQLAFVLAAWIGLQQPLGTLEAYAAQPLAAGVTGGSQSEWLPVSSPSNGQEEETETLPEATPDAPLENPYRGNVNVEIRTVLPCGGRDSLRFISQRSRLSWQNSSDRKQK